MMDLHLPIVPRATAAVDQPAALGSQPMQNLTVPVQLDKGAVWHQA